MKNTLIVFTLLTVTLFIFIGIACQPEQPSEMSQEQNMKMDYDEGKHLPLIYEMSFLQRYATKLYFAGMEENWELADIYAHEIEEIVDGIIHRKLVDDGVNVSELMENLFPSQLEEIETAIDQGNKTQFESSYQSMVQTCNACHQSSDYGAVNITVPDSNPFAQDFTPSE